MQIEGIKAEISELIDAGNILFENHKFIVVFGYANQIPQTLEEIGRLRELNFRLVGEGTGKNIDLDEFDEYYLQVIAWNKKTEDISGAARLGEMYKIFQEKGAAGIYSRLEFEFDKAFFEQTKRTVELSRLFVNASGKKNYFGLYLIFCGISNWMAASKYYTHLLGSVSISKTIPSQIHGLIIEFCKRNYYDHHLSNLITPLKPAEFSVEKETLAALDAENPTNFDALNKFVEEHYRQKHVIPILFKKYHIFKANYLAFGIDDDFSSVTDPLIHVAFAQSEPEALAKFVIKDLLSEYLESVKQVL